MQILKQKYNPPLKDSLTLIRMEYYSFEIKMLEKLNQLAGSNTEEYRELKIAIDKYQS